jgi:uncharacterized protein (TIGR02246 family)
MTEADMETAAAAVNDIWNEYASSLNSGNVDRWISLWTEDGVQMPPGLPSVVGKRQIRATMKAILDRFAFDMAVTPHEVREVGDWAFSRGIFKATMTPREGGKTVYVDGKYMTILQRQADGSWKIHRDIFNSNTPPNED